MRTSNIFKITPEMMAALDATSYPAVGSEEAYAEQGGVRIQDDTKGSPSSRPRMSRWGSLENGDDVGVKHGGPRLCYKSNGALTPSDAQNIPSMEKPTAIADEEDEDVTMGEAMTLQAIPDQEPPHAPLRRQRTMQTVMMDHNREASRLRHTAVPRSKNRDVVGLTESTLSKTSSLLPTNHKRSISGYSSQLNNAGGRDPSDPPQRRSVRLFNQIRPTNHTTVGGIDTTRGKEIKDAKKTKSAPSFGRKVSISTVGRVVSGNRKPDPTVDDNGKPNRAPSVASNASTIIQKPGWITAAEQIAAKRHDGLIWLLNLFNRLGDGYLAFSRYRCSLALQIFNTLPPSQRETPWVQAHMGKAQFEMNAYRDAEKTFARVKKLAPSRLEDMEIYSTVLWHLKSDSELAFLGHELIEIDRCSPQAWISVGNSLSLHQEHDQAIKCFRRATQLDPKFCYAHTLLGHEHMANEEFDKALVSYRSAIGVDQRGYAAWYGLGRVYEKMGKWEMAEKHYELAAKINPSNAVLVVCIGQVSLRLPTRPRLYRANALHRSSSALPRPKLRSCSTLTPAS